MMTTDSQSMVLAHDAFTQFGGAERVFEAAAEMWPESDIYTLAVDQRMPQLLEGHRIVSSPLQSIYDLHPKLTHLFALIPIVLRFWGPKKGHTLLSFSSSFIKALRKPAQSVHINYCHTPTRFLWVDPEHAYKEIPKPLHFLVNLYFSWMKRWDLRAAQRVDYFIANSQEVQRRIKQFYGRDSELIYPFIDTNFWKPTRPKQNYFLVAGRLQYAKGLATVIEVFNELGWELHVVGTGRFESTLKSMAKGNVRFLGRVSDEVLRDEYSGALGYVYPQFEDFGLMPLEAAGCGTATMALAKGGSLETVKAGITGELLNEVTKEYLNECLRGWDAEHYRQDDLLQHADRFNKQIFQDKLRQFVQAHGND